MAAEEKNTAIFTAYDEIDAFDPAAPEKGLLKAILLSALSDLKKPGELSRKASEYFLCRDDKYIFSFVSVCDHLSVDPHVILAAAGLQRAKVVNRESELSGGAG